MMVLSKFGGLFKVFFLLAAVTFGSTAQDSRPLISLSRFQPFRTNYFFITDLTAPKEMKIQMSVKYEVWSSPLLYFGYIQKTFWNALELAESFPLTEVNFHPMGFWEHRFAGTSLEYLHVGYEHESNGKHAPEWRAWDLVFVEVQTKPVAGFFMVRARGWLPLYSPPENTDITDFVGHGELEIRTADTKTSPIHVSLTFRKGTTGGFRNASVEANLALKVLPLFGSKGESSPNLCWNLQLWSGVGERLLNYSTPTKSLRTGFSIVY